MGLRNLSVFVLFIKEGWEKAFSVAKYLCFLHVTNAYVVTPVQTYGPSMLPTFDLTESLFLGERISTRFGKVARGDIIILRSPQCPRKYMTKRLVGMEGDTVTYLSNPKDNDKHETVVVPKGHVWVQGDNIYKSKDSRNFGPVPYGLIESKMCWRVWPLKNFGPV
ncbi:mitochondrial inner membrane protease subunit 1-like isoform X1 [Abrus precatorius]|uniref:Mitochondrial inner membrane protease subunit 1-like isoform X1 n=1 Tax=Abrus precatorius TaxID=3816 RepID=A0A8B8LJD1_ABRPR|nr:mitochondrial inner membrane protease subunit 1-like isoform X1 [Abrus precatorius]